MIKGVTFKLELDMYFTLISNNKNIIDDIIILL